MERITGKHAQSMMEAVAKVYENPEIEIDQIDEAIADDPKSGVLGQAERLRRKMFGTPEEVAQARSYEASINALTKRRGPGNIPLGADGKPITPEQIAAETRRRRLAQQTKTGDDETVTKDAAVPVPTSEPKKASAPVSEPKRVSAPSPTFKVGDQQMTKSQINAKYAELRKTDPAAAKKFGDKAFAATNPKIAAARAERVRTRGTSATTNPLMGDMKSRMPSPAPKATTDATPPRGGDGAPGAQSGTITRSATPLPVPGATRPTPPPPVPGATRPTPPPPVTTDKSAITPEQKRKQQQAKQLQTQSVDLFDIVKGHLMGEGATENEAFHIMANMSSEEMKNIMNMY